MSFPSGFCQWRTVIRQFPLYYINRYPTPTTPFFYVSFYSSLSIVPRSSNNNIRVWIDTGERDFPLSPSFSSFSPFLSLFPTFLSFPLVLFSSFLLSFASSVQFHPSSFCVWLPKRIGPRLPPLFFRLFLFSPFIFSLSLLFCLFFLFFLFFFTRCFAFGAFIASIIQLVSLSIFHHLSSLVFNWHLVSTTLI